MPSRLPPSPQGNPCFLAGHSPCAPLSAPSPAHRRWAANTVRATFDPTTTVETPESRWGGRALGAGPPGDEV